MATNKKSNGSKNIWLIEDFSKNHFCTSFVTISAMAWQEMPFFNFPHYKSMGNLSCHSNQTKEPDFHKKHKLSIPQPMDATDEIWAQIGPVALEEMLFEKKCFSEKN